MADVEAALIGFAELDEAALGRPWAWPGGVTMEARYALYGTLEDAQAALVAATARPHPESRRILAFAQRAFGDLRGLLLGLPEALLDREPRPGEWPLREVLRHVLAIERRYAAQTLYAVERGDAEPVRIPEARMPVTAPAEGEGDATTLLARLARARRETDRQLADLPAAALARPTVWLNAQLDVRFRLHRFAAHIVEHTVQCDKTLAALGWRIPEGRRIVRQVTAALGELEGLGAPAEVRAIEASLVERFASVSAAVNASA